MQRINRRTVGVSKAGNGRAGTQDCTRRRSEDSIRRSGENLPDLRWTGALCAYSWCQKSAIESRKINAQSLDSVADGSAYDDASRTKVLLLTLTVKVRQLGHDMTSNADSICGAGVLDGRALRVRGEGEDEHSPAGLTCKLECRSQ